MAPETMEMPVADSDPRRVVLVTGASSGFGALIAQRLALEDWRVYGASRRAGPTATQIQLLRMDVTDDHSVEAGVRQIIEREGRLDAIVSNAGNGIAGAIEDTSTEEALDQFQTNFFGNHRVCRAALPHLRARDRAHIVVIGSLAGLVGIPFQGLYSASKFALEGYCEALRMELRETGVAVTIVEPGDFQTAFTDHRRATASSGASSAYAAAFARARAVMEADETGGADPSMVADAVAGILASEAPPQRQVVASREQAELATAKAVTPSAEFEAAIARHYGLP
jgi:NAD(P)-dependent dehydrogenase (short-subunit alcohol dehydrogenase family)